MKQGQAYLNLTEAAEYLGYPLNTAKKVWPHWLKYGVNAARRPGGKVLMFKRTELDRMVERCRVIIDDK